MVLKTIPHQDAAQIGMPVEDDTVKIEDFALLKFRAAPDRRERRQMDLVGAIFGAHTKNDGAVFFLHGEEVIDDFEMADGMDPPDLFNLLFHAIHNLFTFHFFGNFFASANRRR